MRTGTSKCFITKTCSEPIWGSSLGPFSHLLQRSVRSMFQIVCSRHPQHLQLWPSAIWSDLGQTNFQGPNAVAMSQTISCLITKTYPENSFWLVTRYLSPFPSSAEIPSKACFQDDCSRHASFLHVSSSPARQK